MSEVRKLGRRRRIRGRLEVPGDKSISHRALLFGALADGPSRVRGLSPGADVASTRALIERFGVECRDGDGELIVEGRGWEALRGDRRVQAAGGDHEGTLDRGSRGEPAGGGRGRDGAGRAARKPSAAGERGRPVSRQEDPPALTLDCGNSGTTARLVSGLLAGRPGRFRLTGDASLSRRPMRRVFEPLRRMGARIEEVATLPATIEGAALGGKTLETGVASAQVKSALILAALQAEGASRITEPRRTRDHSERMLRAMGAPLAGEASAGGLVVEGGCPPLAPLEIDVPGDPSSAAYAAALAAALSGSQLEIAGICLNPSRLGFYRLLREMGAEVEQREQTAVPEPRGALVVRPGELRGIEVGAEEVVDAIDELPLLACVGAVASGETVLRGAAELRAKESDRIAATARLLRAFGAEVEEYPDGLRIAGGARLQGAAVGAEGDHRIAMCAAFLASLAEGETRLSGGEWVAISYPRFFDDLEALSA